MEENVKKSQGGNFLPRGIAFQGQFVNNAIVICLKKAIFLGKIFLVVTNSLNEKVKVRALEPCK